jgi:hypothetical protein
MRRFFQAEHLGGLLLGRRRHDLLAGYLRFDQLLQLLSALVLACKGSGRLFAFPAPGTG